MESFSDDLCIAQKGDGERHSPLTIDLFQIEVLYTAERWRDRFKYMTPQENLNSFNTLVDIIARLRGPQGCPWDRKQTHLSLKPNLIEECYEVIEAIDQGDSEKLSGELGDLLMLIRVSCPDCC